jgi:hypothetical protein
VLDDLLTDVLTFLCFLQSDDVAPLRVRFLRPQSLARLNTQLIVADRVELSQTAHLGGQHGTTELETDRIRFIHFLCEASGLVALTGRFLKPTPRAAQWLRTAGAERAQPLFDAAFPVQPDRALDDVWRAYRLPGRRLVSPTHTLAPLLSLLRQMRREDTQRDEPLKLATLLKLVDLDETTVREVLRYLDWFGAIEWRSRSALHLTDWGAVLLRRADAPSPPPLVFPAASLRLPAARGEITRALQTDWPTLYELSPYTELVSARPGRVFRLDHARLDAAFRRGVTSAHIAQLVAQAIGQPVPKAAWRALDEWARQSNRLVIRRVILLEAAEPALLAPLSSRPGRRTRADILRTLSPRAVLVRESQLPVLIRRLERQGLAPRVEFPLPSAPAARRRFDQPSLAYLYLSVRLCHQLSDLIPSAYRAPYSLLLDLEKQLAPRDRDLAAQLADEAAQNILDPPSAWPLPTADHTPGPVAETVALIERAIESGTPLEIVYYSPYRDEVTTRAVEPHRIEWRGQTPYLIAYCRLDADERTFRVDRIRECRVSKGE